MNFFKPILFLGGIITSYAQIHIRDNTNTKVYNNAILQANTTGNDIKGFKFPRKVLSGRTDYLTTLTDENMVNSMLIFNNKQSNLSKGLYFWNDYRWENIFDDTYIKKLSQIYHAETKISERIFSFITDTTDSSSDVITIGMEYDPSIFLELSNSTTNLTNTFSILNDENIIKFKTTGIIQLDNVENIPYDKVTDFNQASMGVGIFLRSPGESSFKLIAYSVVRAHITTNCTKLPFNTFEYAYNLKSTNPSEYYEVKVAFDKRDFSLLSGSSVQVSLGASDSPNCVSSDTDTKYNESRSFLPKGASNIFLTTEIFELVN